MYICFRNTLIELMVQGRELVESGEVLDPASKLEQDYIQMFLGKLEPMQVKDVTLKKKYHTHK